MYSIQSNENELFENNQTYEIPDNDYLLLVDYYSKWPEVHKPDNLSSKNTIPYVKSTFSRNGVPDIFFTDNGCQFSSQEFKEFATEHGFTHRTSSPTYPQSNGQAERTVQTVKRKPAIRTKRYWITATQKFRI
jgi:transposase InsO family protein